ncbi:hypothetical protein [Pedobacter gandavensis]|uniref:hypothetical protein n=1 Tax=Pedobacter gandavensis TaxID=2679963 RepID=UPI00292E764B|nr:hypothetical protein [Pedobacter gandavensis]
MEEKELTTEQALQVLYNVTGQVKMNREEHKLMEKAFHVIVPIVIPQQPEV